MAASKKNKRKKSLYVVMFAAYLILLFYFLFFSEGLGRASTEAEYRYNLTLFREIKRFIEYRHVLGYQAVFLNVVGNVIAFMPFGFFLPRITRRKVGLIFTVFSSGLFSLLVETIQLYSKAGSFDVDDLILNTFGGLCGYIVYFIIHKIRTSRKG